MAGIIELAGVLGISQKALFFLVILVIWESIWKITAMWRAARKNHLIWFILIALLNTAGILPILYIFLFSKLKLEERRKRKKHRKKKERSLEKLRRWKQRNSAKPSRQRRLNEREPPT